MNNIKEIRFCVGNKKRASSLIWKLFVRNDDVYLLARQMGGSWKISLHKSGICRVAFSNEFEKGKDRLVLKWNKIYLDDTISPNIAILVPCVKTIKPLNKTTKEMINKEITYLDFPSGDEKIIIKVFYTKNERLDLESKIPNPHTRLFMHTLKNGETIYLFSWKEKLQDIEIAYLKDQISKFQINVPSREAKNNVNYAFAVWVDEGTSQTHGQPTIVNYPLGYEHLIL